MALLNNLRHYSNLYFHGHSAGGTNPSLLEAMAGGCLIVAHDNIFNREVLGDDAYYFKNNHEITLLLNEKLHKLEHRSMVDHNRAKISSWYNWENILRLIETHVLKVKHNHYVHRS
jgi:glycosyltransferase involved in cell wall biosynthesis